MKFKSIIKITVIISIFSFSIDQLQSNSCMFNFTFAPSGAYIIADNAQCQ